MENKKNRMQTIYDDFETAAAPYKAEAACGKGCSFLMKNRACMIYDVRPFACRRIYSLAVCRRDRHPVLSRQVMAKGDEAIRALQQLDGSGYSGHLSYILYMLETPAFLNAYLAGEYRPEAVMAFGKSHGIIINRVMGQVVSEGFEDSRIRGVKGSREKIDESERSQKSESRSQNEDEVAALWR